MAEVIEVGNKVELTKKQVVNKEKTIYVSQVLDIIDEHEMTVAMPIYNRRIIPLDLGDVYRLCFFTQRGMYQCEAQIVDRYRDGQIGVLKIRLMTDPVKLQRRQYYRLPCVMDIQTHVVGNEEGTDGGQSRETGYKDSAELDLYLDMPDGVHQQEWSTDTLVDISGGGARYYAKQLLEQNALVNLRFESIASEDGNPLELTGRVVACRPGEDKERFECRIEFCQISVSEREILVKYIFEEELKQRRNRWGENHEKNSNN